MRLSGTELFLFDAACSDERNVHAQELMNVFGVQSAPEVLMQLNHAPLGVFVDLVNHIWFAIVHEAARQDQRWGDIMERALG